MLSHSHLGWARLLTGRPERFAGDMTSRLHTTADSQDDGGREGCAVVVEGGAALRTGALLLPKQKRASTWAFVCCWDASVPLHYCTLWFRFDLGH